MRKRFSGIILTTVAWKSFRLLYSFKCEDRRSTADNCGEVCVMRRCKIHGLAGYGGFLLNDRHFGIHCVWSLRRKFGFNLSGSSFWLGVNIFDIKMDNLCLYYWDYWLLIYISISWKSENNFHEFYNICSCRADSYEFILCVKRIICHNHNHNITKYLSIHQFYTIQQFIGNTQTSKDLSKI